MNLEDIEDIESRSDLIFPNSVKETVESSTAEESTEDKQDGFNFKNSLLAGLASGAVFFGVDKFIKWGSSQINEIVEDQDQEDLEDEDEDE